MRFRTLLLALLLVAGSFASARAEIKYRTEIVGVEDRALLDELRAASQLIGLEDRPPENETALTRRTRSDRDRLEAVLRAAGYYESAIAYDVDTSVQPATVRVQIEPGPRYTLSDVTLVTPDGGTPPLTGQYRPDTFGLEIGAPARSRPVVDAEQRIVRFYAERGFPLARVTDRRAVIDRATDTMSVTYTVDAGPRAMFGPVRITGLDRAEPDYVNRRIAWQEGALFDIRDVEKTRRALAESGLFSTIRITAADAVDADGRIPMTIELAERAPRSLGGGVNYDTTLGIEARGFWEHRNLLGDAEKLRVSGIAGARRRSVTTQFRRPDFLRLNDQDFVASIAAESEDLIAFDRDRVVGSVGVERRFAGNITTGAGVQVERTHIVEDTGDSNYTLSGLPLFLRRDAVDDLLDPTRGNREALTVTPYIGELGSDLTFVSSRLSASAYQRFDDKGRFVLAGFAALGSIVGESRDALPEDKRLYAGGGGSVRGYGFQRVGPLDADGEPIGGRSSIELGLELRVRVTETIGIVPFVEAGNVYEPSLPDLGSGLLYGAGLGLRYYTPIGPVRLDVAVPLDRRPSDDAFQIYISLGQAF